MTKLNPLILALGLVCCLTTVLAQDCNNTFYSAQKFAGVNLPRPKYLTNPANATDLA